MPNILIIIIFLIIFYIYVYTTQNLSYIMHGTEKKSPFFAPANFIALAVGLIMCIGLIPLPVFYLILYGLNCISWIKSLRNKTREWIFNNLQFLIFSSSHLIIIGIIALGAQTEVRNVLGNFYLRVLSLLLAVILNTAAVFILAPCFDLFLLHDAEWDSGEVHLFSRYIWFCTYFVIFDSIPCFFSLPTIFPVLFLIGSNGLLILVTFMFTHHVYNIMKDYSFKEESLRLQNEVLQQHNSTLELEHMAYLDLLTGIYTRQYALTNINNMLINHESFTLAFIDLDSLKQINDIQGHLAGDEYLQRFSARMKERLRPNDIFARYGGDEFLIIMPELTFKAANTQLRRIQTDASSAQPAGWNIPFSYGLAEAQDDAGKSAEDWITIADSFMYKDKNRRKLLSTGGIR